METPTKPDELRLAIGPSDFAKLRQPGVLYIDKSDLIRKVIQDPAEAILLPRPRRFGKTTNLSMLRYFFEKSGADSSGLFQDLAVWRDDAARAHFRRYPVVAMTFKDVKAGSWEGMLAGLKQEIRRAYAAHLYLLEDLKLTRAKAERFEDILAGRGDAMLYLEALRELTGTLRHYHGQPGRPSPPPRPKRAVNGANQRVVQWLCVRRPGYLQSLVGDVGGGQRRGRSILGQ